MINAMDVRRALDDYDRKNAQPAGLTVSQMEKGSGVTAADVREKLKPYGDIALAPINRENRNQGAFARMAEARRENSMSGAVPAVDRIGGADTVLASIGRWEQAKQTARQEQEEKKEAAVKLTAAKRMEMFGEPAWAAQLGARLENSAILQKGDAFIRGTDPLAPLRAAYEDAWTLMGATARSQIEDVPQIAAEQDAAKAALMARDATAYKALTDIKPRAPYSILAPLFAGLSDKRSDITQKMLANKEQGAQEFAQGMNKPVADVLLGGGNMLGKAATAAAGKVPFLPLISVQSGLETMRRALDDGVDPEKAAGLAAASGMVTGGVESAFGIAGRWGSPLMRGLMKSKLGQAVLEKASPKVLEFLGKVGTGKIAGILGNAFGEGVEEIAEYDLQRVLENLVLDRDTPRDVKEQLYGGLISFGVGGLFGGSRVLGDVLGTKKEGAAPSKDMLAQLVDKIKRSEDTGSQTGVFGDVLNKKNSPPRFGDEGSGIVPYSNEEISAIRKEAKTYANRLLGVDYTLKDFFRRWKNGKVEGDKFEKLYIGKIDDRTQARISELFGYRVQSKDVIITNDDIRHYHVNHGDVIRENTRGNVAVDENNIDRIITTLGNPDSITSGNKTADNQPRAIFKKDFTDGTAFCVEIDNSGRGTLQTKSFYIKKKGTTSTGNAAEATRPFTSLTADPVPSEDSLAYLGEKVKFDERVMGAGAQTKIEPSARISSAEAARRPVNAIEDSIKDMVPSAVPVVNVTQLPGAVQGTREGGEYAALVSRLEGQYGKTGGTLIEEMTPEDYAAFASAKASADKVGLRAAVNEGDAEEAAKRAAGLQGVSQTAREMLSDPDNGVVEGEDLSGIAQLLGNDKRAYNKDLPRVLDSAAAGEKNALPTDEKTTRAVRDALYRAIERPWIQAKAGYARAVTEKMTAFEREMNRLGIKAGSRESAAVQWIGEGKRITDGEEAEYTRAELQREFPKNWQSIEAAEAVSRSIYDDYVLRVNESLKSIFPDVEARAQAELDRLNRQAAHFGAQAGVWEDYLDATREKLRDIRQRADKAREGTKIKTESAAYAGRLEQRIANAERTMARYLDLAGRATDRANTAARSIENYSVFRNKRMPKRADYFHHFVEMEDGFGGLKNILSTPSDIASTLAGISEYTKPKTKWWGAMQQRGQGDFQADAVGGMARYIPAAEYKVYIDPFIAKMRGTVQKLALETTDTKNANGLIDFLTDWTGDLAGKTNFFDRPYQKLFDRKTMRALEWANNRAKANAIVGNLASAVVQVGNIPNAMAYVPNPKYWAQAALQMTQGKFGSMEGLLTEQSPFLQERYLNGVTDVFLNKSVLRRSSEWMLQIGDHEAAKMIWLAAYNKYQAEGAGNNAMRGYESAVDYADDITRRSVAGRGIGEMPLTQKSRVIKLLAPFQVEVNNTYNLMRERIGEKDSAGLMAYCASAWVVNALIEMVTGRRPLFDPIDALLDALRGMEDGGDEEEKPRSAFEKGIGAAARLGGEVAGNMPYASQWAALILGDENSAAILGDEDPTRYGTGNIAVQTLLEPLGRAAIAAGSKSGGADIDLLKPLTAFAPSYGGKQLERTIKGAQDLGILPRVNINTRDGVSVEQNEFAASRSQAGRVRFPIDANNPKNVLAALTMGPWSTTEGRRYVKEGLTPMGDTMTAGMEEAVRKGVDPAAYYAASLAVKGLESDRTADGKAIAGSLSAKKKRAVDEALGRDVTRDQRELVYEIFNISKSVW